MTDYVKSTNFTSKDSLASGNPLKIVKGTEFDTEFNNIATAVATKADLNSPVFITPVLGTPSSGNLANTVGLPIVGGTTGTLSVARGGTGVTSSTGTGNVVLSTSPTLVTPVLGTPASGTLTNTTGLPIDGGTTGTLPVERGGTGVTTFSSGALLKGAGTSSITVATAADIVGQIGATAVTNATNATTATTQSSGNNSTFIATTAFVQTALQAIYPIGSIYINAGVSTNPNTLLGFGTWTAFGAGRVMVGLNGSDTLFDTLEEIGGSKDSVVVSHTHAATVTETAHTHTYIGHTGLFSGGENNITVMNDASGTGGTESFTTNSTATGITVANSTTGSSGTNANLPPYITVAMWKRTA